MPESPEEKARKEIDALLEKAGWDVQDIERANIHANEGVAMLSGVLRSKRWVQVNINGSWGVEG